MANSMLTNGQSTEAMDEMKRIKYSPLSTERNNEGAFELVDVANTPPDRLSICNDMGNMDEQLTRNRFPLLNTLKFAVGLLPSSKKVSTKCVVPSGNTNSGVVSEYGTLVPSHDISSSSWTSKRY